MTEQQPKDTVKQKQPWYKYPWVWFMISLPASAVIAGLYTVYIAQQNAPQVIVKQNKFQIDKE